MQPDSQSLDGDVKVFLANEAGVNSLWTQQQGVINEQEHERERMHASDEAGHESFTAAAVKGFSCDEEI